MPHTFPATEHLHLIVGRASRPAAGVHARLFRCAKSGSWRTPRTVENPAQPVGEQAGLETRRRRGRPPHMVFILRGPQAHARQNG